MLLLVSVQEIVHILLVLMDMVDNGDFSTLGKRNGVQWYEVLQQHQIIVDYWSGGLRLTGGRLKL